MAFVRDSVVSRPRLSRRSLAPLPWLAPSLLLIGAVVGYPLVEMVRTSFSNVNISGLTTGWVGLRNYGYVFDEPDLGRVLANTGLWVVGVVGITIVISLGLSQLLNQQFPGRFLVRIAVIVPWAASLVMTASVWRWMLNYFYGVVNPAFQSLGLIDRPHDWLGDPGTAFPAMIGVGIIVSVPFTTYVLLAGLRGIPRELYEAARVDGCTRWGAFRSITLPLLRPSLVVVVVLNTIYVFNSLPIIWVMTQGGPGNRTDTTATWVYKLAFQGDHRIDEAAALSVLNVIALLLVVSVLLLLLRRARRVTAGAA